MARVEALSWEFIGITFFRCVCVSVGCRGYKGWARPSAVAAPSVHPAARGRRSSAIESKRSCLCHSPTLRPWIADIRRPTWRGFGARRRRYFKKMRRQKQPFIQQRINVREKRSRTFLSQTGPRVQLVFFKLGITFRMVVFRLLNDEGDPLGSPSRRAAMRLNASAHASRRGPPRPRAGSGRRRAGARRPPRRPAPLRRGTSRC